MRTRSVEMFLATVMTVFGAILFVPGDTLEMRHYAILRQWVYVFPGSELAFGAAVASVGLMRWGALIVNGWHHSTPSLRIVGCVIGAFFWTSLSFSFIGAPGLPGLPGALAWTGSAVAFEWFSVWRATTDLFAANSFGVRTWAMRGRNGNEPGGANDVRRRNA